MSRKILIINGSPRISGDTASLLKELKRSLRGEPVEISAFYADVTPCVDCRACWKTGRCTVRDAMESIYADDYDSVLLASPVYFGTLPGQVLNLLSRLQPWHAARFILKQPLELRPKRAGLILTAGGQENEAWAERHARTLFKLLGASGFEEHTVISRYTDTLPACDDAAALTELPSLAQWLDGEDEERGDIR